MQQVSLLGNLQWTWRPRLRQQCHLVRSLKPRKREDEKECDRDGRLDPKMVELAHGHNGVTNRPRYREQTNALNIARAIVEHKMLT